MDAQECSKVGLPESSSSSAAPRLSAECCPPAGCRAGCALEAVDGLLRAGGKVRGEEVDSLLDFRWLLHQHADAEATLSLFCKLRLSLEDRQYLAMYRIRRWLEHHVEAIVRLHPGDAVQIVPLKLDRYCIEAVRHMATQCTAQPINPKTSRSVRFQFRESALDNHLEQCSLYREMSVPEP